MSKKKHKKFKKSRPKEISGVRNNISAAVPVAEEAEPAADVAKAVQSPPQISAEDNERYLRIRKEAKKVLVILAILFLLLIGTYFLNRQTSVLGSLGDWIYRVANIQTQ